MMALVDCNNFYANCERVFNPSLRGKAIVVLSNNDGCAIARSEEAKALGIEMGTPLFMISELVQQRKVAAFSSNYTLYGSMSERVIAIIRSIAPKVEVYSIDEAFVDVSGFPETELQALAIHLREKIMSHTGLPISVGIAPTKTLAKMANRFAKKNKRDMGVHLATSDGDIRELLSVTNVREIWGVGPQHQKLLENHRFKTALDLLAAPEEWIRKHLSVVGQRLLFELRGVNAIAWEDSPPAKKNICTARSFGELLTEFRDIQQAVASHATSCCRKLRRQHSYCRKVHVFLQTNPYQNGDDQYLASITVKLVVPSNSSTDIIKHAMGGLKLIFRPGYRYLKVGVMVLDLVPQQCLQLGLFDQRDRAKDLRLMKTLDQSNRLFGKDMVRYGTQSYGVKWKLRAARLSPCYTTRIEQVMTVKS